MAQCIRPASASRKPGNPSGAPAPAPEGASFSPPRPLALNEIPQQALPDNPRRVYLEINASTSPVDVRLGFDGQPSQGNGILVPAGETRSWSGDGCPTGTVYAVADCTPYASLAGFSYTVIAVEGVPRA